MVRGEHTAIAALVLGQVLAWNTEEVGSGGVGGNKLELLLKAFFRVACLNFCCFASPHLGCFSSYPATANLELESKPDSVKSIGK